MADLDIQKIEFSTMMMVGAWPDSLNQTVSALEAYAKCAPPLAPSRFTANDENVVACISPGRFLLISESPGLGERAMDGFEADIATVVQLNHSRSAFRLTGAKAVQLLMKGLAIDLRADAFPIGSLFQSIVHDIGVIGLRRERDCFDLLVYQSYASSFHHWLNDAAIEFGGMASKNLPPQ